MWNRAELKAKAKVSFKRNYWKCVLVAFILSIVAGSGTFGGTSSLNDSDIYDEYYEESYEMDYDSALENALGKVIIAAIVVGSVIGVLKLNGLPFISKLQ